MERTKKRLGHVLFKGKIMSGDDYKNAIVKVLKEQDWLTTPEIIKIASAKGYCEGEDYPRKAICHPIYKHLSDMFDKDNIRVITRMKRNGEWEYKLTNPKVIYLNDCQYFLKSK